MEDLIKKSILIIIVTFIVVFTIFTFFFFLNGEEINICYLINSNKFGDFGSFYGGFLGTITASLGLIIVYLTYSYQKIQSELIIVNKLYDDIVKDILNLRYREFYGIDALLKFDKEHDNPEKPENRNSIMNHLSLILTNFRNLIDTLKRSKFIPKKIKEITLDRIYLMFNSKITWPVYEKIYKELYIYEDENGNEKGLKYHTDGSIIFERYFELIRESYKYLEPRGHIKYPLESDKMMAIINNTMHNNQYKS